MNLPYGALTERGLKDMALYLDREATRISEYGAITSSPHGVFLLAELDDRLALVRRLYRSIDPGHESANYLLAALQAWEAEIEEWTSRLRKNEEHQQRLGDLAKALKQHIAARVKTQTERTRMVPKGYKPSAGGDA